MVAALHPMPGRAEAPRRKRFSRQEFDRLMSLGAFEGQRFELIDGDLIDKMGQNPPHAWAVSALLKCLIRLFGVDRVRCQAPIEVSDQDRAFTYPEPDLAVVAEASDEYAIRHPNGGETTLVVEVADTTARFDQTVKLGLYARAGVGEYWVLDLVRRTLFVYRQPVDGVYTNASSVNDMGVVAPAGMPERVVAVANLLPPLVRE